MKKITLDEHFAMLYGPNIISFQKQYSNSSQADSVMSSTDDTKLHQSLEKGFASNPFEAFKRREIAEDEDDETKIDQDSLILDQLERRDKQKEKILQLFGSPDAIAEVG